MNFGFFQLIQIFGAVGVFIYGMKLMSEAIQRAAGTQLRNTLSNITSNKWLGLLTGFAITGIIQSSSAVTLMTVSFVNAGLLTVIQSCGLILGANVGTTVTGWLVSLLGFKISLVNYAVPIFAVAVPLLFFNGKKLKYWGEFLIGFAILLLGLGFLRSDVPTLDQNTILFEWLKSFMEHGIFSRLFFVLVGMVIAIIVQSSSVAMAVTLTMCAQGWLPLEIGASLILGENIGTTSTALIASIIANRNAKISARVHFFFNLIGVSWMLLILPWFMPLFSVILQNVFNIEDIYSNPVDMTIGLSAFHTVFNLLNALVLINFLPWLVNIASVGLPEEESDQENLKPKFLESIGGMPEMATIQLQKEVEFFGKLVHKMGEYFSNILNTTDSKKQYKFIKKIKQIEQDTDILEQQLADYITKLTKEEMTGQTSMIYRKIISIANELERIADLYYQLSIVVQNKIDDNIYFLPEQRENINKLMGLLDQAFLVMRGNLENSNYLSASKAASLDLERKINKLRDKMREEHNKRLGDTNYNLQSALVYSNVFNSLERVGDHIMNITEVVVGED